MRKMLKRYLSLCLSLCMLVMTTPTISLAEDGDAFIGTPEPTAAAETTPTSAETTSTSAETTPTSTSAETTSTTAETTPAAEETTSTAAETTPTTEETTSTAAETTPTTEETTPTTEDTTSTSEETTSTTAETTSAAEGTTPAAAGTMSAADTTSAAGTTSAEGTTSAADATPAPAPVIVALEGAPAEMEAMYGLYEDELELPETLTAVYSDDSKAEISVTWVCISDGLGGTAYDGECEDYEQACFTFEARLPEGAVCAEDLTLPRVQVRLVLPDFAGMLYTMSEDPTITNTHGVLSYSCTLPDGVSVEKQQWLKNGSSISGATGETYTLTMDDMTDKNNVLSVRLILSNSTVATSAGYAMSANDEWVLEDDHLIFTGSYNQSTTQFPLSLENKHFDEVTVESSASVTGANLSCNNLANSGAVSNCTLQVAGNLDNPGTISGSGLTVNGGLDNSGVIYKSGIDCENVNNVDNGVIHVRVTINGEDCSSTPDTSWQFLHGVTALDALKDWYEKTHSGASTDGLRWVWVDGLPPFHEVNSGITLEYNFPNSLYNFACLRCSIEAPEGLLAGATVRAGLEAPEGYTADYTWYHDGEQIATGTEAKLPQLKAGASGTVELKVSNIKKSDVDPVAVELSASATFSGIAYDVTVDYENDALVITPRDGVTIDGAVVQVGNSTFAGAPVDGKCTLPLCYFGDDSFDASLYVYNDNSGQLAGPTSLRLSRAAANVDPEDFTITVAESANADGTRDVTVHCANPSNYNAIRVGEKILAAAETVSCKVQPGQDVTVYARTPGSTAEQLLPSPWVEAGTIEASKWLHLNVTSQRVYNCNALFWGEVLKIEASPDATLSWKINGVDVNAPALVDGMYTIPANVSSLSVTAADETGSITRELTDIECPVNFSLDYKNEKLVFYRKDICGAPVHVHIGTKDFTLDNFDPRYYSLSDSNLPKNEADELDVTLECNGSSVSMSIAIPARFTGSADFGSISINVDTPAFSPEAVGWEVFFETADGEDAVYAALKLVDSSGKEIVYWKGPTGAWLPVRNDYLNGDRSYSVYAQQYSVDADGQQDTFTSEWFDTGLRVTPGEVNLSTGAPLLGDTVTAKLPASLDAYPEIHGKLSWKWYYVDESGNRNQISESTDVKNASFTILPGSGYENCSLRVELMCEKAEDDFRVIGYAETGVIPEARIIVTRANGDEREELEKNTNGKYIAYLGDVLTAEAVGFAEGADLSWMWWIYDQELSKEATLEVDSSICSLYGSNVKLTLKIGDDVFSFSRFVDFCLTAAPEVTIDYENETLVVVKPDDPLLAGYGLRVMIIEGGGVDPLNSYFCTGDANGKYTVPIADLQSGWPSSADNNVFVMWTLSKSPNGTPESAAAYVTIPARPTVDTPTTESAAFTITVKNVSTEAYNFKLTAADATSQDADAVATPTDISGNVRFTGLDQSTKYKLWMQKKAVQSDAETNTEGAFASAWTSFDVQTSDGGITLTTSLNWTPTYEPGGFSLSEADVKAHLNFADAGTGETVTVDGSNLTLTRADGKSFPITDAGTYQLKLTLNGAMADNCTLSTDTLTLTVHPYTVNTYEFASRKTYKGAAYDPYDFELRVGGAILSKSDYTITVDNGAVLRDVGEYTAHIVFKGNYTSQLDGVVHPAIDPFTLRATASPKSREYDGTVTVECSASWDGCAPFAGDDVVVKASGTMADASVGTGKTVAITLWLEGAQSGNYRLASSTLTGSVTIAKEKAPDIDWPTAGDISYGQRLAASVLSHTRDANGTFAWEKPEHVPTKAMEWAFTMIYTPDDEVNYVYEEGKLRKTVTIRVNRAAAPEIQWPTAGDITFGQRLADSVLTSSDLHGSFTWENGEILPPAGVNSCNVVFTPDDPDNYAWTQEMLVQRVEVTVDQKPVSLTVENACKIYGDADPKVEVSVSGVLEGDSLDYSISRRSGEDVGEYAYSVKLGSNPNYRPEILPGTLTIQTRSIEDGSVSISAVGRQTCTGREIKPQPTLRFGGATLVRGTDYVLSYSNNVKPGRATITITGMGNFSGSCSVNFTIKEKAPAAAATATAAPAPSIAPSSNEALQEYLNGMGSLVFDAEYAAVDFLQIPVLASGEEQEGILLICASQEEGGEAVQRSLILDAAQLVKLQQALQENEIGDLIFKNGSAAARMNLAELTGGNMAKLMALILSGEEITEEILQSDWSAMEDAALTEAEYERFSLEVRIAPVVQEDGEQGFEISVWLCHGAMKLNVSDLIDSLCVMLDVSQLVTAENVDSFEGMYAIAQRCGEEIELLDSALVLAPAVSGDGNAEKSGTPTVIERYALTALYAGEGMYRVAARQAR